MHLYALTTKNLKVCNWYTSVYYNYKYILKRFRYFCVQGYGLYKVRVLKQPFRNSLSHSCFFFFLMHHFTNNYFNNACCCKDLWKTFSFIELNLLIYFISIWFKYILLLVAYKYYILICFFRFSDTVPKSSLSYSALRQSRL